MRDYLNYQGKVCVVTGAATGMGRACIERLVDLGAVVYALDWVYVDALGIEKYIYVDMGNKDSIDACFAQLPETIDKFFGFAGVSGERNTAKKTIEINFLGNKYAMEEYLSKRMSAGGAIVIVTSVGGNRWYVSPNIEELEPLVNTSTWDEAEKVLDVICEDLPVGQAYTYSKRAMTYFTMKFALEMMPRQIRVNAIKPGNALTCLTEQFMSRWVRLNPGKTEADYHAWCGHPQLGGGTPSQMAEPCIFLNSDMASFISGAELLVDYTRTGEINTLHTADPWACTKLVHPYKEN